VKVFSCFSGIEAASVAFKPLGFEMVGFSEVDKFCSELLKQKFPNIKNYGDITKHRKWKLPRSIDFLCGGPPCQSFSLAGLRKGMEDARGNLSLEYLSFLKQIQPRWILMENVFGILSSNKGRDFGTILASLAKLGYGFAYCVLDAQNFGVPQRRRRVFVVGHSGGDWKRPAQVLFNAKSLFGHIEESGEKEDNVTKTIKKSSSVNGQGYRMTAFGQYVEDQVASTIKARDYKDATDLVSSFCVHGTQSPILEKNKSLPLGAKDRGHAIKTEYKTLTFKSDSNPQFMAFDKNIASTLTTKCQSTAFLKENKVRRLTPLECERLQGFPDNWTRIAYRNKPPEDCPDGPRYKAIGNSWAVPVVRWIGERIKSFDG